MQALLDSDPKLPAFEDHFQHRYALYSKLRRTAEAESGSLEDFASVRMLLAFCCQDFFGSAVLLCRRTRAGALCEREEPRCSGSGRLQLRERSSLATSTSGAARTCSAARRASGSAPSLTVRPWALLLLSKLHRA